MYYISFRSLPLWAAVLSFGAVSGATAPFPPTLPPAPMDDSSPDSLLREAQVEALRLPLRRQGTAPRWEIDAGQFARCGITSTTDALRQLPGINLRDYGGAGGVKTVSVRGLGAAHTQVTLDGLPVLDARSGAVDFGQFDFTQLSSLSLQVADDARLLVPVRALSAATIALESHTERRAVGLRVGSFGTVAPSLLWSTRWGSHSLAAVADWAHGDNAYPFTLKNGRLTTRERRQHSTTNTLHTALRWRKTSTTTQLSADFTTATDHRDLPGPVMLYTQAGTEQTADHDWTAQLRYHRTQGRWEWMGAGKAAGHTTHYLNLDAQFPDGRDEQQYRQGTAYATAGAAYHWNAHLSAAYAADYTYEALKFGSTLWRHVHRHSLQQSVSLRWSAAHCLLTARLLHHRHWNELLGTDRAPNGLPWEQNDAARNARRFTPSLSLAYRAFRRPRAALTLRLYAQQLFRLPSFAESYYFRFGNTHLRPELTRQIGVGGTLHLLPRQGLFSHFNLTLDAYANRVTDRIVATPRNPYIWQTTNLGSVEARGGDTTLDAALRLNARQRLNVALNYSFQRVEEAVSGAAPRKQLAYTPVHSGTAALGWEHPWATLSMTATFASERWSTHNHAATTRLPGYAELGLTLRRHQPITAHQHLDCVFAVTNLTDQSYEVVRRYPMPGRAYQFSLNYSF